MGGCRCSFRDCKVSTNRNPRIHFFHFPKRGKHLLDWISFSDCESYLKITESQQRNKVICGRHFKDACFMNYKQDRLVATAVPSITRLSTEWALDYTEDLKSPKLIKMNASKAPHLIAPPEFKDPQCFNAEDQKLSVHILELYKQNVDEPGSKRIKLIEVPITQELPNEENQLTEEILESLASDEIYWTSHTEIPAEKTKIIEPCSDRKDERVRELEALLSTQNLELDETKAKLENSKKEVKMLLEQNKQLKLQLASEVKAQKMLRTQISDSDLKYFELVKVHDELKERQQQQQPRLFEKGSMSSLKHEVPEAQRGLAQSQQLSKQQLFNGIKRYLSPTMVAILRMQLASCSTERDWKPDEKRVAVELLGLGDKVYKYFTDEWLIRLPSINSVLDWQNEIVAPDDEDIL